MKPDRTSELIALIGRMEVTLQQADEALRDLGHPEDHHLRLSIAKRLNEVAKLFTTK